MAKYKTAQDLASKIDYEGGAVEFVFRYGFTAEEIGSIDLPMDVVGALIMLQMAQQFVDTINEWVENFECDE